MPLVTAIGTVTGGDTSAALGAEGGRLDSTDGALSLHFPPGALTAETRISIQAITATAPAAVRAWRLSPDGAKFSKPVEIVMSYGDADVRGSTPEALQIGFQDAAGVWNVLKHVQLDTQAKTLTATTTHFTDWSLLQGILLLPVDPTVMIGERVTLVVNNCARVVQRTGNELVSLRSHCEPEGLQLRTDDWSVNGIKGGDADVGYVSAGETGIATFTAPAKKPNPALVAVSTVCTDPTQRFKCMLVSNITIVDQRGWYGSVSYTATVAETLDETTVASTVSTNTKRVTMGTGSGTLRFEPYLIPDSMIVSSAEGSWTESFLKTIIATNDDAVCPWVQNVVHDMQSSGAARSPVRELSMVMMSMSGGRYQLRLGSLAGFSTGSMKLTSSGNLTRGGAHCTAPVPSNQSSLIEAKSFPQFELLVEGDIDPGVPNVISGQKTFTVNKGLGYDTTPAMEVKMKWEFQK